jgi:hypothetical protein
MVKNKSRYAAVFLVFILIGCSSQPERPPAAQIPDWIHLPTRKVDNGYIVYVESADDSMKDRARFKSDAEVLADIANECTLIPKGVRIEDRYEQRNGVIYQTYTKAAVELELCEEAKKAATPEAIRKLANVPMTEQVKKYQEMIGQTPESLEPERVGDGTEIAAAEPVAPFRGSGGGVTVVVQPATQQNYYVMREQVFIMKSQVVLAPPGSYQPQSPETAALTTHLAAHTQAISQYEQGHPELRTASHAWSGARHDILRQRPRLSGRPMVAPPNPAKQAPPAQKRRRRRNGRY